jgi:hypothetical protein
MQTHPAPDQIHYSITPTSDGVMLRVWELDTQPTDPEQPYRFQANHRLHSEREAHQLLQDYLQNLDV